MSLTYMINKAISSQIKVELITNRSYQRKFQSVYSQVSKVIPGRRHDKKEIKRKTYLKMIKED